MAKQKVIYSDVLRSPKERLAMRLISSESILSAGAANSLLFFQNCPKP
jgi:hypothetical protein